MNKNILTYKRSGVDINAADKFVKFISTISSNKKGKKSLIILVDSGQFQIYQKILKIQKL